VIIEEIEKVCYIGAGTMGCANSLVAAISGYNVAIYDVSQDALDQVAASQIEMGAYLVSIGFCSANELTASAERIACVNDLIEAVADADLVSESVIEDVDVKREVHAQLDKICPSKTILTTNTSGLLVSDIEDVVARGDRFAALHSHFGSLLIDIVPGPRTSDDTIDILSRYVQSCKCVPLILRKENRGYVLNNLIAAVITNAMLMYCEGIASAREIDSAWMQNRNAPMGPFGMMDLFGLNVVLDAWQHRPADPATDALKAKVVALLASMIDDGKLGTKSGEGFYRYPNPEFEADGFLSDVAEDSFAQSVLTSALVCNAILIAANDIADPSEIDRAWKVGMLLDAGPFEILKAMGKDTFLKMLHSPASFVQAEDVGLIERYIGTGKF
jgi:3-hydroxybutyryl-CoA dehydrogenase